MELNFFKRADNDKTAKVKNDSNNSHKHDYGNTESIDTIFTTTKIETERGSFSESFEKNDINSENSKQGKEFLKSLSDNKASLSKDLELSDDEYDSLACIAMALASQETGMGLEDGIGKDEDGNILVGYKFSVGKLTKSLYNLGKKALSDSSASSGLTQIKIYDCMKNDGSEMQNLMAKYGITANDENNNNLNEPDKAAVATMIYLADIVKNSYPKYENLIEEEHKNLKNSLDSSLTDEQCLKKGEDIINSVKGAYKDMSDKDKEDLRTTFKQWFLGKPGYEDERYNEEKQLEKLNEKLSDYGINIKQSEMDYIRYYLTDKEQDANSIEYIAYAWNKGADETGMKLDRILADKIGVIFSNNEKFDYDQFTVNVVDLTDKYAQQAGLDNDDINEILSNYSE